MKTTLSLWGGGAVLGMSMLLAACGGDAGTTQPRASSLLAARMSSSTAASVDSVEVLAEDGLGTAYVTNAWGGHQGRITRHQDGSIRILYIRRSADTANPMEWRVMLRAAGASGWTEEKTGTSTDDVNLLLDPTTDTAYVVAYPNSVPTIYEAPSYKSSTIPGTPVPWQTLPATSRHYSAVGMGADGTMCFKTSVELATPVETSNTETHFVCGRRDPSSGWVWNTQQIQKIGNRYTYDYLFPGGFGTSQLVATAQSDLHRTATDFPNASLTYIFNGIGLYTADISGTGTFNLQPLLPAYSTPSPATTTLAPVARMIDSYMDSQKRLITTYYAEPGTGATAPTRGFYTIVRDAAGNVSQSQVWSGLAPYGFTRIFEDGSHRMWMLWTNQGTGYTQVKLYALTQDASGQLTLGAGTEFSTQFKPYAIEGAPRLALTSRGQQLSNTVEVMFAACEEKYGDKPSFSSPYYPNETPTKGTQKIIRFRINLPPQ